MAFSHERGTPVGFDFQVDETFLHGRPPQARSRRRVRKGLELSPYPLNLSARQEEVEIESIRKILATAADTGFGK